VKAARVEKIRRAGRLPVGSPVDTNADTNVDDRHPRESTPSR
jgi:hypothetical protein